MAKKIKKKSLVKHSDVSLKKNKAYKHSDFKTQRKGKAKEEHEDTPGSDFEVVPDQDKRLPSHQSYEASDDEEDHDKEYMDTRQLVAKQNRKKKKSGGFQSMGLSNNVFKGILRKGYKIPTPIQRKTIPVILDGKDVVAMARTGSGKTAAFLIPMFERLKAHSAKSGARVLIMSPTRELALQTLKFTKELGRFTGLRAAVVLGGDRMEDQFAALHENPDIIIATPGRFLHVVMEMDLKLKSVEYVVFDEADRLFEMGFQEQLTEILYRLPESRQTLLFSATLPRLLVDFAKAGLQDPTLIRLDVDTKLSDQLKSSFFHCRGEDKVTILLHLLLHVIPSSEQTVVFAATKHHVEYLHMILKKADISSTYIYSSLDQAARKINLAKFQHKRAMVMIVTDLAARGIDIPLLDNVINFHFPAKPKLFLHRVAAKLHGCLAHGVKKKSIFGGDGKNSLLVLLTKMAGRVARAGRCGTAYSLIAQDEVAYLLDLHLFLGRPLKPVTPEQQEVKDSDGLYGGVPQSVIDDMEGKLRIWMVESSELQTTQKVCENAMKQYLKSRPVSALESIKRAKQMDKTGAHLGIHPIFRNFDNEDEVERLKLLNSLKSYKGNTTIFEINSTSKTSALSVMKQKRSFHGNVIQRKLQKIEEMQQQQTPEDPSCRPSQSVSLADDELIHSVFHNMIGLKRPHSDSFNPQPRKKQKHVPVRDEENYLHYRPKDYQSEQGLQLTRSFDQEVSGAVMDITGDEEESLRQSSKVIRWDRKKKKFMRGGGTDLDRKNKIRTESGAWIAASYKSKIYKEWMEKNKIASQEEEDDDVTQGKQPHQSQTDRFMVLGTKRRKWHTKGMEKGANDGQKNKFKRELKRPEQIMKERRIKQRKQASQKSREHVKSKRRFMKAQRTKK